ncbi:hypothetical protein NicSoilB8_40080 [Arthrobacter sp. NicSoilB8]|nr:hypothetical protein NicSoilB8_40080 [Arthrobacter sp. NicSoilB8]
MALVILSTIASALSISGRDRYIWDWNEDGEAKSLRSGKWAKGSVSNKQSGPYLVVDLTGTSESMQ